MKKIILTFFVLVLILILMKRVSFFNQGCTVASLGNPRESDFYQCFLNDLNSYNQQYRNNWSAGLQKIQRDLGKKIKNYFISLYIHGLEKDYRLILAFVPANYNKRGITILPQNHRLKDFMKPGFENGRYELKDMRNNREKLNNMMKSVQFGGENVYQYHGFLVGMGFKIALSNPRNNRNGSKCSRVQLRPDSFRGICVPGNLYNLNEYFTGGRYFDYFEINRRLFSPSYSGGGSYYLGQSSRSSRNRFRSLEPREDQGCHTPRHEQRGINFHKANQCQRGCYLRSRRHCRSAYGDQALGDIIITVDVDFFNRFFNSRTNTRIKNEFLNNNFRELNDYHS